MLDLCRRNGANVTRLEYRAVHPLFHTEALSVNGNPSGDGSTADLWIANGAGNYAMTGKATLG
jgi:hydroxyacyl-ACP dehydratase HTD2-like protein with hotdog domain